MADRDPQPASPPGDFERYGLLAALTLVVLCLLAADRRASAPPAEPPPRPDRLLHVRIGGRAPAPRGSAPAGGPQSDTSMLVSGNLPPDGPPDAPPAGPRRSPATADAERTCVVQAGETLGAIARRELGTSKRADEIARLNGLPSVDRVRAGQTLRLPPR